MRGLIARVLVFGAFGWLVELGYTTVVGRPKRASAWMVPIYGLAGIAFPPLHASLRRAPLTVRALAYGAALAATEYAIGRALRASFGAAPWTYAGKRWSVDDVTRLDYVPLWALYGVALERLDELSRR